MEVEPLIRTILIDDERPALNNLERFLRDYDEIEVIGAYTDVFDAFEEIKNEEVHLILLDIEMPKMKGIVAAEKISEIDSDIQIVFITAYNNYALDAFEVNATDYVMKPIMKRRLDKTMEKVIKKHKNNFKFNKSEEENKILCFGNFEIRRGQQCIKWRTSKAKELAAYLIHHRGKFIHKSKIIEELWNNKEEEHAIKLLHTNIYYVRSGLKTINLDHTIVYSNEMYKFDIGAIFCDVEELEKVFSSTVNSKNIEIFERAVRLYRAEYLEENDYCWAVNEQVRINKKYVSMLTDISEFYVSEGKYTRGILYLKLILEKEPYDEEIHRKLLNVYASIKDYDSFKEHYKDLYNSFKDELGVELSNRTKEMYENLFVGC